MKQLLLSFFGLLFFATVTAQPFTATYTFADVSTSSGTYDPTEPPTATGVYFGSFEAFGVSNNSGAGGRFSFSQWPNGATNGNDNYASLTGNLNENKFYEIYIYPEFGYSIDLTSITFSVQRSGTGIRTYSVRSYHDDFTANLPASINPSNANLSVQNNDVFFWNNDATTSNQNGSTIMLSDPEFTGNTDGFAFRFYGWNAEGNAGTFSIDNVIFTGSVTQMPVVADFYIDGFSICEADPITFIDASQTVAGTISSWQWNFGDGSPVSSLQNPVHTYAACGEYPVSLTVTNSNNESNTVNYPLFIGCKPVADFSVSAVSGCDGLCVDFTDLSTVGGQSGLYWEWDIDGDTLYDQNPQYCFGVGNYDISLTVYSGDGCMDNKTNTDMISVSENPVANFTFQQGEPFVFTNTSTGATEWHWDFGDLVNTVGDTSNLQNPSWEYNLIPDAPVTACLTVKNDDGCSDTFCQEVIAGSVNSISMQAIVIYPNPSANGIFTIDFGTAFSGKAEFSVMNMLGEMILSNQITTSQTQLDLSDFAAGNYLIKIISKEKVVTRKILIN